MRRRIAQAALVIGTCATILALYAVHSSRIADNPYGLFEANRAVAGSVYTVLLLAAAYLLGLPDAVRRVDRAIVASLIAPAATVAAVSLAQLAVGDALLPRFVVFSSLLLVPLVNMACSVPNVLANRHAGARTVALLLSDQADELRARVASGMPSNLQIEGIVEVDSAAQLADTLAALDFDGVDMIVVSDQTISTPVVTERLLEAHRNGVRIRTLLDFYEEWFRLIPLSELEDVSLLFDISELHSSTYVRFKRVLDLSVASALTVALGLCLPFVLVGNFFGNRGSLWFSQPRVGKDGHEFEIYKLRTMNTGSRRSDRWTTEDDARVTPFGKVLRRLHIDEFPQAYNIFKGELSVVGPRPEQPQYVAELMEQIPYYDVRHLVRPGLTGLAQVALGYTSDVDGARRKLQYELYYLRNQSILFDLRMMLQTLRASLRTPSR